MAFFSGSYVTGSRKIIGVTYYGYDLSTQGGVYMYAGAYPQHFFTSSAPQPDAPLPTGSFVSGTGGQFDMGRKVITKFCEGSAHGPIYNVPRVSVIDDWSVEMCYPKKAATFDVESGRNISRPHVGVAQIDFRPKNIESTNFGASLLGSAGTPFIYDGSKATELGFYVYPELRSAVNWPFGLTDEWRTMVPDPTGSIAPGYYGYSATYHWTDDQGNEYRSAPSPIAYIETSGSCSIDVRAPCLTLTNKSNISISIWRTVSSGSTLFKVTSGSAPLYNRFDLPYVTWKDDMRDELIESNEILYTISGELPNNAPPISDIVWTHGNRVWLVDANDLTTLWFSKPQTNGLGAEFSDSFIVQMPREGGPITALSTLSQDLIIFKSDSIYTLSGQGPDVTGRNGFFSTPFQLPIQVGCINKNSVVQTALGVFFQSKKGIYLLNGQGALYIGASIEDTLQDLTITSAVDVQAKNQVRFSTLQGTVLVYDYYFSRWSTSVGLPSVDAVMYNDKHTIISSSGLVRQETPGTYTDDGQYYSMTIGTPNIALRGLQGFTRIKRATVMASYKSDHVLVTSASFDYDTNRTESCTFQPNSASGSVYQFSHHIVNQKCQSVRFTFSDTAQSGSGESYTLEGLNLRVLMKDKANRLPSGRYV